MSTEYNNPIISGFAPDPSVVAVEGIYFLVNSSFHLFPGLPIYASTDLKSWSHVGNAINRSSQIDLSQAVTDGFPIGPDKMLVATLGLFAPTIRWHKGTFYIICTNVHRKNNDELSTSNFYVTTTDIWANKWSDPIWFEYDGIDPSFFFDNDSDKVYVQASWREGTVADQKCSIRQFEIDPKSGEMLSDVRVIWKGGDGSTDGKSDIEGPHMYQKDGYYYLLAADGGTFEHHKATISRSKDIWGPFEVYNQNPVLTADGTDEYVQHVGHADLFQDHSGRWWAVALGVRNESGGRYPMGRETFLVPVEWPSGGWPVFGRAKMQFHREGTASSPGISPLPRFPAINGNVYIRDAALDNYQFSEDGRTTTLTPSVADLSTPKGTTTFVGQRQRSMTDTATVTLHIPKDHTTKAGLALYKEDYRHVDLSYDSNTRKVSLETNFKLKGGHKIVSEQPVTNQTVHLRIQASATKYEFSIRDTDTAGWIPMGSIDTLEMTASDFNGTVFGIFAHTLKSEGGSVQPVSFEDFKVVGK